MEKLKKVIFWGGIFIIILTYIIVKPLNDLDEMWNFNVARCIANGLVPYKDISMVSMPLLGFFSAIFLKIFGSEMFVTRILAAIIAEIILMLIYKICKNVKMSKSISSVVILAILYIMKDYFCLDYNFFVLAIGLAILLIEVKKLNNDFKKDKIINLTIGILGGLAICTKQTIGLLICFIIVANPIFYIKNKEDLKTYIKNAFIRIIGIIIPVLIFIIYLLCNNAIADFIDYSILGIKTFTNKIEYTNLINSDNLLIKILSIIAPIILVVSIIINIVLKILKKQDNKLFILTMYCLPIFIMAYPIADNIHFLISIIPIYILVMYYINLGLIKFKKIYEFIDEYLRILEFIGVVILTIYIEITNMSVLGDLSKYTSLNHFKFINIGENVVNMINNVDEYILSSEKNVYILDSNAALYMIPADKYNKNYDMFLKGNLGSGGEETQIENIKSEDAVYLILNDNYSRNWQNPDEVTEYIKENLEYKGQIEIFDIYENK